MCLLEAMTKILKIKSLKRLEIYRPTCEKSLLLKYHLLQHDNFLAHLLCQVTYVIYFNKCSDPDVKLANL